MSVSSSSVPGCGNLACVCGRKCGCPFGACSCEYLTEDEEPLLQEAGESTTPPTTTTTTPSAADLGIGEIDLDSTETVININIGVLGHVNSGKTSLVRALSRTLSTAALDKNPQSKERGMTLDLGFSSFATQAPPAQFKGICDKIQFTLVDCPGHASLIKTIIKGAQIIDRMLLVVDVTKGIQMQTAECLVLGEILTDDLILVLNKIDLLPVETRQDQVEQMSVQLRNSLSSTPFANCPIVPISAFVNGGDESLFSSQPLQTHNLIDLVKLIRDTTQPPDRSQINSPLYFSVDHCFPIKGMGTVLTGTVLSGTCRIGDEVELPEFGIVRKIKSIQRFHRNVNQVSQGDRASFGVSQLDAKRIEHCVLCAPKSVPSGTKIIALIRKVRYFEKSCVSGSKMHITVGPTTGVAKVSFFGSVELKSLAKELVGKRLPNNAQDFLSSSNESEYLVDAELKTGGKLVGGPVLQFVLLEFDAPVVCPNGVQLIGSRLDLNNETTFTCRIGFYGKVCRVFSAQDSVSLPVKLFKHKEKVGAVDRVMPNGEIIGRGLFKRDTDITLFLGLKVTVRTTTTGEELSGIIDSSFGKTGKFKVIFRNGTGEGCKAGDAIVLKFKKYVGNSSKKIVQ